MLKYIYIWLYEYAIINTCSELSLRTLKVNE